MTNCLYLSSDDRVLQLQRVCFQNHKRHQERCLLRGVGNLVDFSEFKKSLQTQESKNKIIELQQNYNGLIQISKENLKTFVEDLEFLLSRVVISNSEKKIVAFSKLIHHLLPQLVPPIDLRHTIWFFYHEERSEVSPNPLYDDKRTIEDIFPYFHKIASQNHNEIQRRVERHKQYVDFHTSETKVIDNAIVGFALKKLHKPARKDKVEQKGSEIEKLFKEGLSGYAIAKRVGLRHPQVYSYLKKKGLRPASSRKVM